MYNSFSDKDENRELPGSEWDHTFSEENGRAKVNITIFNVPNEWRNYWKASSRLYLDINKPVKSLVNLIGKTIKGKFTITFKIKNHENN